MLEAEYTLLSPSLLYILVKGNSILTILVAYYLTTPCFFSLA